MKKKYTAKTDLSLNVKTAKGYAHIRFDSMTKGGSVYYTENEVIQAALESHPQYGRLYKADVIMETKKEKDVAKKSPTESSKSKEVKVDSLSEAKDYLVENYGYSRTQLRTKDSILSSATESGIEFKGLQ